MNIREPVKELPYDTGWGRWRPVWDAVVKASPDWVPVELDTESQAGRLATAAVTHRTLRLEVRKRGRVVHLRLGTDG